MATATTTLALHIVCAIAIAFLTFKKMSSFWQWLTNSNKVDARYRCVVEQDGGSLSIQFWDGSRQVGYCELDVIEDRMLALLKALVTTEEFQYYQEPAINGSREFGLKGDDILIGLANYQGYDCATGNVGCAVDRTAFAPLLGRELEKLFGYLMIAPAQAE